MRIALGCDHAAVEMANVIMTHLVHRGVQVSLHAPDGLGESYDYPVYAEMVARAIKRGESDAGILICGTGVGMSIAANKVGGIRAVNCSEAYTARLAKEHNNANVICFGARVVAPEIATMIVDTWLDAKFEGGRHARRVDMFEEIEKNNRD